MNIGIVLSIISGILSIIFAIIKFQKLNHKAPEQVAIFEILLFGILSFFFGVLGLAIGLTEAFNTIAEFGDISPSIVAGGIKQSILKSLTGLLFLFISVVLYFIINKKKSKLTYKKHNIDE